MRRNGALSHAEGQDPNAVWAYRRSLAGWGIDLAGWLGLVRWRVRLPALSESFQAFLRGVASGLVLSRGLCLLGGAEGGRSPGGHGKDCYERQTEAGCHDRPRLGESSPRCVRKQQDRGGNKRCPREEVG